VNCVLAAPNNWNDLARRLDDRGVPLGPPASEKSMTGRDVLRRELC